MLGAIVETVLAERAGAGDVALLLDSDLVVEREDCSVSFLLVPDEGGVEQTAREAGPVVDGRRRWSGWVSSPPRPSPATCSCPSVWARASAWRCSTGASAWPGWRTSCCPASTGNAPPGSCKFADIAVPELIDRVVARRRPPRDARGGAGRRRADVRGLERDARGRRPQRGRRARPAGRAADQRDRGRRPAATAAARSASTSARARSPSARPAASSRPWSPASAAVTA